MVDSNSQSGVLAQKLRLVWARLQHVGGPTLHTENPAITGTLMEIAKMLGMEAPARELKMGDSSSDLVGCERSHDFSVQMTAPGLPVQYMFKASARLHQDGAGATFMVRRSVKLNRTDLKIVARKNPITGLYQIDQVALRSCIGSKLCDMEGQISCEMGGDDTRLQGWTAIMASLAPHIFAENSTVILPANSELDQAITKELTGSHLSYTRPLRTRPFWLFWGCGVSRA